MDLPAGATNALLLPGAQPPLSHFGVTLLRHVVVTGLRYTLYHLGLPMPDKAPIRIHELRLYLDAQAVANLLATPAEGRAVAGALVDPGGSTGDDESPPSGAAFFHRQRLRWKRRRGLPRLDLPADRSVTALEYHFRQQLALFLPHLNDALLDEVVTVLRRRQRRRRGAELAPCLGPAARDWTRGYDTRSARLGAPDAFVASWREAPPSVSPPALAAQSRTDAGRGGFRELYRLALDALRPTLLRVAEAAMANGVIDHRDDVFFLPFELLDDLTVAARPPWLDAAVLRNRAEYFGLRQAAEPALVSAWDAAPLEPLA